MLKAGDSGTAEWLKGLTPRGKIYTGAQRYNANKLKVSLFEFSTLEPIIRVLEYGAHKYSIFEREDGTHVKGVDITPEEAKGLKVIRSGTDNWKQLPLLSEEEVKESLMRHTMALLDGEENDPESGLPHIGHIGCNLMFLTYIKQVNKNNKE